MRNIGIQNLNKKIKDYEKLGINYISKYKTIEENFNSILPIERYSSYLSFNKMSKTKISSGSKTINRPEQINVYYNKYPINKFDVVINPYYTEPTVQFLLSLKMKFEWRYLTLALSDFVEKITGIRFGESRNYRLL